MNQPSIDHLSPPVGVSPRRILVNAGFRSLADLGSKIASVLLFVVMARRLGDASFGIFTFGLSLATLLTILADFGQDRVLTREVSRAPARLDRYVADTLALKLVLGLPPVILAAILLAALGVDRETWLVALLLGFGVLAELLAATIFAVFQSFERMGVLPVVLVSQRLAVALGGVTAILLGAGVVLVAAIYLAGAVLVLPAAFILLVRRVARPRLRVAPATWTRLLRAALPIGLAGVFAMILFRVDMVMLAAFEPRGTVGDYGAAYRILELTLFVSWSVGTAVYPVFARLTTVSEPPVGLVFERALKLLVALTLPLAAAAIVLAEPLLTLLFGRDFEDASTALVLLGPSIALYPLSYIAGYLLISQDRQRATAVTYGIVALENVGLNFVLIPWLSLNGAALGTTLSELLVAVTLLILAQRVAGQVSWPRVCTGPVLGTILAATVMIVLRSAPVAALAAAALVYAAVLLVFERLAFPDDARALAALLRRRN